MYCGMLLQIVDTNTVLLHTTTSRMMQQTLLQENNFTIHWHSQKAFEGSCLLDLLEMETWKHHQFSAKYKTSFQFEEIVSFCGWVQIFWIFISLFFYCVLQFFLLLCITIFIGSRYTWVPVSETNSAFGYSSYTSYTSYIGNTSYRLFTSYRLYTEKVTVCGGAKFGTNASGAIWCTILQLMQVAQPGGKICN